MRTRCSALLLLLATVATGCEHKNKKDAQATADKPMGSASGTGGAPAGSAKPLDDTKAEPVAKPAEPTSEEDVRAPVAADLAAYTKDLPGDGPLTATIETSLGTFHCALFGDKAPVTVANFVGLATGKKPWRRPGSDVVEKGKPFFDGLIFHRVIPRFMIQGGDPTASGAGGPGYRFADEVNNGLAMQPGTLAMANTGEPSTNGSQFFITEVATAHLTNRHTIFGQCKEVDLVTKITGVPRGPGDRPETPVTITKVTIAKGPKGP